MSIPHVFYGGENKNKKKVVRPRVLFEVHRCHLLVMLQSRVLLHGSYSSAKKIYINTGYQQKKYQCMLEIKGF